jgi:lipopolysaccharide export system permease protein
MLLKFFSYQNTILSRYIRRNLLFYFSGIIFILGLLVFGNQVVLTVQESVEYGIPFKELIPLVGFNMLRDIPIILSLSLFLSIIITISQLYKNSEAVVMNSIGLNDKNFIQVMQPIILFSFIIVFFLTVFAVPWAKQQKSYAEDETLNASEFSFISEGRFESFKDGDIVFYASESNKANSSDEQNMEEVFIYANNNNTPVIVLASEATKYTNSQTKSEYLRLKDGFRYEGLPGSQNIKILDFDQYDLEIVSGEAIESFLNFSEIEEKTTTQLIIDGDFLSSAELQWRLSQPISIFILSVLGVFLGKSSPRTGKGINLIIGLVIFLLYNNSLLIAKSSIETEQLSPFIGMWPVHLFLIILIIIFYQYREGNLSYYLDKISFFNFKEKKNVKLTK